MVFFVDPINEMKRQQKIHNHQYIHLFFSCYSIDQVAVK